MSTSNKPVLGYRDCPDCGERGSIHQAAGRRHQLYQRCACGCDQRNGRLIQSKFWYQTAWLEGLQPDSPPAVIYSEEAFAQVLNPEPGQNPGQVDRVDRVDTGLEENENPGQQTEIEPGLDREVDRDPDQGDEKEKTPGFWPLAAVLLGLAVAGAAIAAKAKG